MNIDNSNPQTPDYARMNAKLNLAWSSANYSNIGIRLQITGEELAESAGFKPGSRVLDVAAGNGNATLAFARRWCDVLSTDYVEQLLDDGRRRVEAEGLDVEFMVADAQCLPFEDGEFDGVVSSFGVMFAPDQKRAASELLRVCKPGGKIALASWTPPGFVGRMCKTIGQHMSTSPGFKAPANWGREEWIKEQFGAASSAISFTRKNYKFRYASPEHYLEYFKAHYGLLTKAFEKVGEEGKPALERDILSLVAEFNSAEDESVSAQAEYAEVLITKS